MDRSNQINKLLKQFAEIFIQNPNFEPDANFFYTTLMNYGLSEKEYEKKNITHMFDDWTMYFKNNENLNVYHSESQKNFLQFANHLNNKEQPEYIKIYVPFSGSTMNENVKKLFSFFEANNIETHSKVSNILRSDSVVLRIAKQEDASKVINYINNSGDFADSINPTNPFLIKSGSVGLAMDGEISYNSTITTLLELYFKKKKMENKLETVSALDFGDKVRTLYQRTFVEGVALDTFAELDDFKRYLNGRFKGDKAKCLTNFSQVIELIDISLNSENCLADYVTHVKKWTNVENKNKSNSYFEQKIGITKNKEEQKDDDKIAILKNASVATINKYGYNQLSRALVEATKGNYNFFTNGDSNLRAALQKGVKPEEIIHLCKISIDINGKTSIDANILLQYCDVISGMSNKIQEEYKQLS